MAEPTISVVIPTYNRAHLVGLAIASALRELRAEDECLVIDDGSTDETPEVIGKLQDRRLRYIRQPNAGAGVARNRGAREASGDFLAFLDSDDEWLPGKVEIQRRFMAARPDILFCFTDLARDFGGKRQALSRRYWHSDPRGWEEIMGPPVMFSSITGLPPGISDFKVFAGDIYRGEMRANYLSTICIMIRRKEAGAAIHFNESVSTFEDWECFGRLAKAGRAAFLDFVGALQVKHPGPRVTDANWLARAESRLVVLKNVWGSDPDFLAKYGNEYLALVREQELQKVHGLLSLGRTRQAREEISRLNSVPAGYRLLSRLPARVVTSLVAIRRALNTRLTAGAEGQEA